MIGKENLNQRHEMKHHPQTGRMQCDAAEQIAGAGERDEGVHQSQ